MPTFLYTVESDGSAERTRGDLEVTDPDPERAIAVLTGAAEGGEVGADERGEDADE